MSASPVPRTRPNHAVAHESQGRRKRTFAPSGNEIIFGNQANEEDSEARSNSADPLVTKWQHRKFQSLPQFSPADTTMPMTCMLDRQEHEVTEVQFVSSTSGRYPAICGHIVTPGSLASPPGRPCSHCQNSLNSMHRGVQRETDREGSHVRYIMRRITRRTSGHAFSKNHRLTRMASLPIAQWRCVYDALSVRTFGRLLRLTQLDSDRL